MALTEDQLHVWDGMQVHVPKPSGGQTPERAANLGVASFLWACDWDGLGLPSVEDALEELRERGAHVLPDRAARSPQVPRDVQASRIEGCALDTDRQACILSRPPRRGQTDCVRCS